MSLFSSLRSLFGGGPRRIAGFGPPPGPFDEPPTETVELDPAELPWELRDSADSGNSGVTDPAGSNPESGHR